MTLKQVVEESNTLSGRLFDFTVQSLVLVSIVSFSIETLPAISSETRQFLGWVEIATVSLFTLEYALRLAVADSRRGFALSFFGIVDLVAILPFYLSLGVDLRSIRVVRFLRIFRLFKLARYSRAMKRLARALSIAREELLLFGAVTLVILYIAAVGIYYFERDAQPERFASVFHSLWWAVVTLTTVGYGDIYPVTTGGRFFTFIVLAVGLGVVAVPTGILASALSAARQEEADADRT